MAGPRGQIGFEELGVAGVLRRYRLEVPANQREYAWTEKQVSKLFQDLTWAVADEQADFYFLGTIVTIPRSPDLLEVVDGQQRLATTAILLSEIRHYLKDKEPLLAESINPFLTDIDREKRERVAKLTLNLDDNEFFRLMIAADSDKQRPKPSHPSHGLILEAFNEARKHVKKLVASFDSKQHGDVLNRWIQFLEHHAQIILLKVPTEANAYKMFETLNDRGLKTSQADLVKNYLFGQSGKRLAEAQQKWARMRSILETLEEDDITVTFLRQSMIAIRGHLREEEVFDAVHEKAKGPQTSIEFLTSLETLAASYVAIFNPDHEKWNPYPDSVRHAIRTLNLLNIRSMRPLFLAVAARFAPKQVAEASRMFISWGVRLIVASSTSRGSVEEPLAAGAHSVFRGDIQDAQALRKELSKIIPGDEEFRRAFEFASVSKAAFARYYLRSLEMAAKNEATPWFIPNDDKHTINLEHVLPEVSEYPWSGFGEDTAKTYVRRIGNLALLLAKSNSDLKSSSFETKKGIYKDTAYVLTSQIAKIKSWGPKEVSDRQKVLADLALKTWPL